MDDRNLSMVRHLHNCRVLVVQRICDRERDLDHELEQTHLQIFSIIC